MEFSRTQIQIARSTFVMFMVRERTMNAEQARYEFDEFLMANAVRPTRESFYLRVFRQGATVRLTRLQRASIYMSFENALNHATF